MSNQGGYRAMSRVLEFGWNVNHLDRDVIFACHGGVVRAHKFILSLNNHFIQSLFESNKDPITTIHVPHLSKSELYDSIELIYKSHQTDKFNQLLTNQIIEDVKPSIDSFKTRKRKLCDEEDNIVNLKESFISEDDFEFDDGHDEINDEKVKERVRNITHYTCNYCGNDDLKFTTRAELFTHFQQSRCNANFDIRHFVPINCRKFVCDNCPDETFKEKTSLQEHVNSRHMKEGCPPCDLRDFKSDKELLEHVLGKHSKIYFSCIVPGCATINYTKYSTLRRHLDEHHLGYRIECKGCGKLFDKMGNHNDHFRKKHKKTKEEQEVTCEICGMKYQSVESYRYHKISKHSDKRKDCKICDVTLPLKQYYSHVRKHHKPPRPKVAMKKSLCVHCGIEVNDDCMKRHVISNHLPKINMKCYLCDITKDSVRKIQKHVNEFHKQKCKGVTQLLKLYNLEEECSKVLEKVFKP